MSHFWLVEAMEAEGLGGGGVIAPAFGDVQAMKSPGRQILSAKQPGWCERIKTILAATVLHLAGNPHGYRRAKVWR
jgi:hypothetical protein